MAIDFNYLSRQTILTLYDLFDLLFIYALKAETTGSPEHTRIANIQNKFHRLLWSHVKTGKLKLFDEEFKNNYWFPRFKKCEVCEWLQVETILGWLKDEDIEVPVQNVKFIIDSAFEKRDAGPGIEPQKEGGNKPEYCFKQDGQDNWRITFYGKELGLVKHSDGMQYIAIILGRGQPISATNLYQAVKMDRIMMMGGATEGDALLDNESIKIFNRRLSKLEEDLEEAKTLLTVDKKEEIEDEIHEIKERLHRDTDINNKSRKFADDEERIRQTVKKAISTAINNISKADKELGEHFRQTIETGKELVYKASEIHHILPWKT